MFISGEKAVEHNPIQVIKPSYLLQFSCGRNQVSAREDLPSTDSPGQGRVRCCRATEQSGRGDGMTGSHE